MSVVIETTVGDITVDLYTSDRPRACLNFLKLCKIKYYNFNLFHTISRGFIAQTGDPSGSRSGGESLYAVLDGPEKRFFEGENEPRIKHTKMGLISFVGNEDRMIGSQFFLTLGEDLTYLDEKHCVFGEVVEGYDVLEIINEIICDSDDRPYQDVRITHTVILDDPFPNPRKLVIPSRSPSPSSDRLKGGRIAPDEEIDEFEGRAPQEIAEMRAEREAKARATILEMVGDLPDADMAPPENVLFVCKLNPVTNDDDLEIIFSRFGKIKSCEVIRDKKTGDSLQYAFVEFEDKAACENAYFKMDNVLIDDRRIHVDFSQSVSKVKWRGKGRGVTHYNEKGETSKYVDTGIGKGNYKLKKNESNRQTESRSRNRARSRSPITDAKSNSKNEGGKSFTPKKNKNNYDDYSRRSRNHSKRNASPSLSPERKRNRYSKSPSTFKDKYRSSERSKNNSRSHRDRSRSVEREKNDYNVSKLRNRSESPRRQSNSSTRRDRDKVNSKRRSRSLSPKRGDSKRNGQHEKSQRYDKPNTSSRKISPENSHRNNKRFTSKNKKDSDSDSTDNYDKTKRSKKSNKKNSPKRIGSNSKSRGRDHNSDDETKVKRNKKTKHKYSSEDSSSDSDRNSNRKKRVENESSDSDYVKPKSKKKSGKKNRRVSSSDSDNYKKRTKKKYDSNSN